MSEKRKSCYSILLKKAGNKKANKVEIFRAGEFESEMRCKRKFRIRVNGKWWPEKEFKYFNLTQIKELVFKSIGEHI